jgi:cellobiose phosphorylase
MPKYGYFDQENKEYVITRPDTPLPWINYLGAEEYCALMSNTAGGYSFYRDPKERRITRYRYNNVPQDRGGRYVYIRDNKTEDFWSTSWQPVMKKDKYECRHGVGYTVITTEYANVQTKTTYFVPLGENLEIWMLEIKSKKTADLSIFPFVEFCLWDALNDMTDYQYNLNIGQTEFKDNIIYHLSRFRVSHDVVGFLACANAIPKGFDTQRRDFMGTYGDFASPRAVVEGKMNNSIACGWAPVGALMLPCRLKANETKTFIFVLGFSEDINEPALKIKKFSKKEVVLKELAKLKEYWDESLDKFSVRTPDNELNIMANVWNQYQCRTTFNWSRSASYYESGIGRGMGFRDSNQDTLGFVHMIPTKVKERIKDLAATQLPDGSAYHQYSPLTKKANPSDHKYGDDHLWLIYSVASYLKETGDLAFLKEKVTFAGEDKGTMYEHLARAIRFSLKHIGSHGLPKILFADWNDCLNLDQGKGKAESVMVAQMLVGAAAELAKMAELLNKKKDAKLYQQIADKMKAQINKVSWDGEWYVRAYTDDGEPVGAKSCPEGKIYLETQAWAVISGTSDRERGLRCLESVHRHLATEHGIQVMTPPYSKFYHQLGSIGVYPPGLKENGAIFCHPNPWAMVAECLLGHGDRAYEYYRAILPAARGEIADLHKTEPYVYCQMIAGKYHKDFGEGKNSWLTGSACWNFVAMSQYILGIRPEYSGLKIDPCIPKAWKGFSVKRTFRGADYLITVRNPYGVSKGIQSIVMDGKKVTGNILPPAAKSGKEHRVEVMMG